MRGVTTHQIKHQIFFRGFTSTLLVILMLSCGSTGKSDKGAGKPPEEEKPVEDPNPLQLTTRVGINAMGYKLPLTSSCLKPRPGAAITSLSDFILDGRFDEWTDVPPQLGDIVADAPSGLDLGQSRIARLNEDLLIAAPLAPTPATELMIEMGGAVIRKGVMLSEERLLLRWRTNAPQALEEWEDGAFVAVQDSGSGVVLGASGLEVRLSRRLLGDATTWPAFWIRLYTGSSASIAAAADDSSFAGFFPSLLGGDAMAFEFTACTSWSSQKQPFVMEHVIDRLPNRPARDTDKATFSIDRAAESAFQLVRFAHDATQILFNDAPLPLSKIYIFATTSNVNSPLSSLLTDMTAYDLAQLYGPLLLNVSDLDQTSAKYFPEGVILRQAAARFIGLQLQRSFPKAPVYLRQALSVALMDQLLKEQVGMSYWFDTYLPTVEAFTREDFVADSAAPETLEQRAARLNDPADFPEGSAEKADYQRATADKINAFGHLLFADYPAATLIKAWRLAPTFLAAGINAEAALAKALAQALGGGSGTVNNIAAHWRGWLVAGSYHQDFSPAWLGDRDQDGIPTLMERVYATSDDKADTDDDGWNDIAELTAVTDPLTGSRKPDAIMPDGNFGDWLELIPRRITADKGSFDSCPKAANISHYAALVNRDALVIGAYATAFWEADKRAKWEAVIDFPAINRQFLITAVSGTREILVKDGKRFSMIQTFQRAMPLAKQTIEWVLDRQTLGVSTYFNQTDGMKIRLRTVFHDVKDGKDHFCDETDWFEPAISL